MQTIALLSLMLFVGSAGAQQVYRCMGAAGKLEYADKPCGRATSKQELLDVRPNSLDASAERRLARQNRAAAARQAAGATSAEEDGRRSDSYECRLAKRNNFGTGKNQAAVDAACYSPSTAAAVGAARERDRVRSAAAADAAARAESLNRRAAQPPVARALPADADIPAGRPAAPPLTLGPQGVISQRIGDLSINRDGSVTSHNGDFSINSRTGVATNRMGGVSVQSDGKSSFDLGNSRVSSDGKACFRSGAVETCN